MALEHLALSRSTLDRAAHHRTDPQLLVRLMADGRTRVLPVVGGRAPVTDAEDDVRLRLGAASELGLGPDPAGTGPPPGNASHDGTPLLVYLGEDSGGLPHVAAAWPEPPEPSALPDDLPQGGRWATLREVGALLDDAGAGMLTTAVALSAWHATHPRCARCGAATDVVQAGWTRRCPECGAEHFPRTDPAVIMSVVDDDGRILLGHQAAWPPLRYSTLAGFVEPGESLEAAVRREVAEETGVSVGEVSYRGSQPWPFPSSLMLGFAAHAVTTRVTVDGDELADARWWTRDALTDDVAAGRLLLPPRVSIARRLIEDWYGGSIEAAGEVWR